MSTPTVLLLVLVCCVIVLLVVGLVAISRTDLKRQFLRTGVVSLAGRHASSTTEVEWGPSFPDHSSSAERALEAVGARDVVTVDDVIVGWTPLLLTGNHPEPQQVAIQAVTD